MMAAIIKTFLEYKNAFAVNHQLISMKISILFGFKILQDNSTIQLTC